MFQHYRYLVINYTNDSGAPSTKGIDDSQFYYLINKNSKLALTTPNQIHGENVVQKSFDLSNEQIFHLIKYKTENGIDYYLIKTERVPCFLKANTSAVYNDSVQLMSSVSEGISDSTLWQIKRNWDGSFKFIPKSSNGNNALSVYEGSTEENGLVCLGSNIVDFSKEDDWTLIPVERRRATLYGANAAFDYIDSKTEVLNFKNNLEMCQYTCRSNFDSGYRGVHADEYIDYLFDSQIWFSSDHGDRSRIYFFNGTSSNKTISAIGPYTKVEIFEEDDIVPTDEPTATDEVTPTEIPQNNRTEVVGLSDYDGNLNSLQIAMLNSCSSGADNGSENLVGLMYEYGAHCIISQTKTIIQAGAREWYEYFHLALHGGDVEFALEFADRITVGGGVEAKHILGDTSVFYNYEANAVIDDEEIENNLSDFMYSQGNENNQYYATYGNDGDLYGYLNYNNGIMFYAKNHKSDKIGNNIVNRVNALNCANAFLSNLGYNINEFTVTYSNDYSSEFVIKYVNKIANSNIAAGDVRSFSVIVEEDENDIPYVTFLKAVRKRVTESEE